jgi:hypothetical protein
MTKHFLKTKFFCLFCSFLFVSFAAGQEKPQKITGRVIDQLESGIPNATVLIIDSKERIIRSTVTDSKGSFIIVFSNDASLLRIIAPGFTLYEKQINDLKINDLTIRLSITIDAQNVTVSDEKDLPSSQDDGAGSKTFKEKDLDALPDDPDELNSALQALAGTLGGPDGGQIYLDNFSGNQIPPKAVIREIRINQNPFAAENDRFGLGRIEIFTKSGNNKLRGQGFLSFNDEALNSRNPFAPERFPYQDRRYGGNLSGPLGFAGSSYFIDFERRETDDNAIVNATILNENLTFSQIRNVVLTPQKRTNISLKWDSQIDKNNTLIARYSFNDFNFEKAGIGNLNLSSRAYDTTTSEHIIQLSEMSILNPQIINEFRAQYQQTKLETLDPANLPAVLVLDAFIGGGGQAGNSSRNDNRLELQNNTSVYLKKHFLKFGGRLRFTTITDFNKQNFGGTFTFTGGFAPNSDPSETVPISSIERYRRTILFQLMGMTGSQIRALGGGVSQFTISSGLSETKVKQADLGLFIQDEWQIKNNFNFAIGLRYETQSNLRGTYNLAPRAAFAWSFLQNPKRGRYSVIRVGSGIFYDRINENLILQSRRFDGNRLQSFIVTDPVILDQVRFTVNGVANIPSLNLLNQDPSQQLKRSLKEDLTTPYTIQSVLSFEQKLGNLKFDITYLYVRGLQVLRERNINAPLNETANAPRPFGEVGNIWAYESSGQMVQHQIIVNLNEQINKKTSFYAFYVLGNAKNDTDGIGSFPSNQYDLRDEFGRSSTDVRHRAVIGSNLTVWHGIRINPFIIINSGRPFNIISGLDVNRDGLFTDRPSFAVNLNKPSVINTVYGIFDLNPAIGERLIPRNYGNGPSFFSTSLTINKTFVFKPNQDKTEKSQKNQADSKELNNKSNQTESKTSQSNKNVSINFSLAIQNLFNRSNLNNPNGNLSSPIFGQSTSISNAYGVVARNPAAGNRRVTLQVRLSF